MRAAGLDPAAIPSLPSEDALQWIQAHLYETHDLWHAVTGFDVDVAGELGLQAFYAAQVMDPFPTSILCAGLLNTLFYRHDDKVARLEAIARGWLLGRAARPLFGYAWAERLATPLAEVRKELGLPEAGVTLEPAPAPLAHAA